MAGGRRGDAGGGPGLTFTAKYCNFPSHDVLLLVCPYSARLLFITGVPDPNPLRRAARCFFCRARVKVVELAAGNISVAPLAVLGVGSLDTPSNMPAGLPALDAPLAFYDWGPAVRRENHLRRRRAS